ncbi:MULTISPECIES: hypothetical protein [unclassified Sphingosinithalassobacter]|uniref:hypothetical protein n=1 Tax=unclassified Sphingosinithalassobacter TaxID=2676235 RepID=UPI00165E9AA5|nr:hypothetical protein [Sphingosinithalassobacter sp. CS137]
MYAFLDQPVQELESPYGALLEASRTWVHHASTGRCACAALAWRFEQAGAPEAARDFVMAMQLLNREGLAKLHFGPPGFGSVRDDEARLLVLFAAGLAGTPARVHRLAATLVREDAVRTLAIAVEQVALRLSNGIFLERDR